MSLWIKICGITDRRALDAAAAEGADAVGLVFAPSIRRVTPDAARSLADAAAGRLARVAVFVRPSLDEVRRVVESVPIDLVQCDAEAAHDLAARLSVRFLPVERDGAPDDAVLRDADLGARVLFESARSGAGVRADWTQAARLARAAPIVLAGGLHAGNIGEAVARVGPAGVDVSSGVEDEPGRKSERKIAAFIAAARRAAAAAPGAPRA